MLKVVMYVFLNSSLVNLQFHSYREIINLSYCLQLEVHCDFKKMLLRHHSAKIRSPTVRNSTVAMVTEL